MHHSTALRHGSALLGLTLALSTPLAAGAANVAGSWSFSGAMAPVETIAPVCVFRQSGNVIAGSCKGPAGIASAQGTVSGSSIVFQWTRIATSALQRSSVVTFRGVSDGSKMYGKWSDSVYPGRAGTFLAHRV